jgi:hypothetical protein
MSAAADASADLCSTLLSHMIAVLPQMTAEQLARFRAEVEKMHFPLPAPLLSGDVPSAEPEEVLGGAPRLLAALDHLPRCTPQLGQLITPPPNDVAPDDEQEEQPTPEQIRAGRLYELLHASCFEALHAPQVLAAGVEAIFAPRQLEPDRNWYKTQQERDAAQQQRNAQVVAETAERARIDLPPVLPTSSAVGAAPAACKSDRVDYSSADFSAVRSLLGSRVSLRTILQLPVSIFRSVCHSAALSQARSSPPVCGSDLSSAGVGSESTSGSAAGATSAPAASSASAVAEISSSSASAPDVRDSASTALPYSGSLLELPLSLLQSLWHSAPISPCGDATSQETGVDLNVRYAKELAAGRDFTVSQRLLDRLADLWHKHMMPKGVRVEAYKLNLYGEGGHFAPHKDTPAAPNLVGTILVGLHDSADEGAGHQIWTSKHRAVQGADEQVRVIPAPQNGEACVQAAAHSSSDPSISADSTCSSASSSTSSSNNSDAGASVVWRSTPGSVICFYPDVTHAVLPVKRGMRATIEFNVFALKLASVAGLSCSLPAAVPAAMAGSSDGSIEQHPDQGEEAHYQSARLERSEQEWFDPGMVLASLTREQLSERQLAVLKACETPFALLLDYFYTQNTPASQLRGSDSHLYSLLSSMPDLQLTLLPVLVVVSESVQMPTRDQGDISTLVLRSTNAVPSMEYGQRRRR